MTPDDIATWRELTGLPITEVEIASGAEEPVAGLLICGQPLTPGDTYRLTLAGTEGQHTGIYTVSTDE